MTALMIGAGARETTATGHGHDVVATSYIDTGETPDGELRHVVHTLGGHDRVTDLDLAPESPGVVPAGGERVRRLSAALRGCDDMGPSREELALATWCTAVSHEVGPGADRMHTPRDGDARGRCFG